MDMDWYAWLRRAGLGADLASEYALLFERNELVAADVRHLDHGVLATMGVAVAKHRLEILKLARKESASPSSSSSVAAAITVLPWRATRLLAAAAHRSARSLLVGCLVQHSAARRDRAAVAPRPLLCHHHYRGGSPAGARRKSASTVACKRGSARKQLAFLAHVSKPMLMLTNGGATTHGATAAAGCFASSDYDGDGDEEEDMDGGEEMRWESMFEDLNPT